MRETPNQRSLESLGCFLPIHRYIFLIYVDVSNPRNFDFLKSLQKSDVFQKKSPKINDGVPNKYLASLPNVFLGTKSSKQTSHSFRPPKKKHTIKTSFVPNMFWFHKKKILGISFPQTKITQPGDSSRAQTSSPIVGGHVFTPWKGQVNSPSQKGHGLNHQVGRYFLDASTPEKSHHRGWMQVGKFLWGCVFPFSTRPTPDHNHAWRLASFSAATRRAWRGIFLMETNWGSLVEA